MLLDAARRSDGEQAPMPNRTNGTDPAREQDAFEIARGSNAKPPLRNHPPVIGGQISTSASARIESPG